MPPLGDRSTAAQEPEGESYGAVLVAGAAVDEVTATLQGIGFTGWIAPPENGLLVVLTGDGIVAGGGRGIVEVGAVLARSGAPTIAVRVRRDRELGLVAWNDGVELGRYSSDPSIEHGAEALAEPYGAELATGLVDLASGLVEPASGPDDDAAEKLTDVLDEELDTESVFESERLFTVLRMLGLPTWVVGAGALPRDIPTGPRRRDLLRLRAGGTGVSGAGRDALVRRWRRRHLPPPLLTDPPKNPMAGLEPWMF